MKKLTIRNFFTLLVLLGMSISGSYLIVNYLYVKNIVFQAMDLEAQNRAYLAAKKLTALNDEIAYRFNKYEKEMYQSLQKAQDYFEKNGRNASLQELQKMLQEDTKEIHYQISLINNQFVIENTTYEPDQGLDFHIIPNALEVVKNTYEAAPDIDLSRVLYDLAGNSFKRYILQKAHNGDYMIQIGLSLNDAQTLKDFAIRTKKEMPNLLDSSIYALLPSKNAKYAIDMLWSLDYVAFEKLRIVEQKEIVSRFMEIFDSKTANELEQKIAEYIKTDQSLDRYYEKDEKQIYEILFPFSSYINHSENSHHVLFLKFDVTKSKQTEQNINLFIIFVSLLLFGAGIGLTLFVKRRIVEPLSILQTNMKQKKEVAPSVLYQHSDEISSMARVYNQLLVDLRREIKTNQELLEQFKTFTGNMIHQVRTPISVIKIALEMVQTENKEALLQIKASLASIEHIYDSLSYTIQKESMEFPKQKLSLSSFLQKRVALFSVIASANDTTIESSIEPDIDIFINPTELEYLIDNNLSNAIKYGSVKKPIFVKLTKTPTDILLAFDSYGKAIEDTKTIFKRYKRGDTSKRRSGIGLHMVESICRKNNIFIKVEYMDGKNCFVYLFENTPPLFENVTKI